MGFDISHSDVDSLYSSIGSYQESIDDSVKDLQTAISGLSGDSKFSGATADNMKAYFSEVHGAVARALSAATTELKSECAQYVSKYGDIDSALDFRFHDSTLNDAASKMQNFSNADRKNAGALATVLGSIADIVSIASPKLDGLDNDFLDAGAKATTAANKVSQAESQYKSVADGLNELTSALSSALGQCKGARGGSHYVPGSFAKSKAGTNLAESVAAADRYSGKRKKLVSQTDSSVSVNQKKRVADKFKNGKKVKKIFDNVYKGVLDGAWLGAMVSKAKRGKYGTVKKLTQLFGQGKKFRSIFGKDGLRPDDVKGLKWLHLSKDGKIGKILSKIPSTLHSQVTNDLNITKVGQTLHNIKGSKIFKVFGVAGNVIGVGTDAAQLHAEGYSNGQVAGLATTHLAVDTAASAGGKLAGEAVGTVVGGALGSVIPGAGTVAGGAIGSFVGGLVGSAVAGWAADKWVNPAIDKKVKPNGK